MRSHSHVNHRDQEFPRSPIRPQSKSEQQAPRTIRVQIDVSRDLTFFVAQDNGRQIFIPACETMEFYSGCRIVRARSGTGKAFNLTDLHGICELHEYMAGPDKVVLDLESPSHGHSSLCAEQAPKAMFCDVVAQIARANFQWMTRPDERLSPVEKASAFARVACNNQFQFEIISQLIFVALLEIPLQEDCSCLDDVLHFGVAFYHFAISRPWLKMFVESVRLSFPNLMETRRELFGYDQPEGLAEDSNVQVNSALADADDEDIGEDDVDDQGTTECAEPDGEDEAKEGLRELQDWLYKNDVQVDEVKTYLTEHVGVKHIGDLKNVSAQDYGNLFEGLTYLWNDESLAKTYVHHLFDKFSNISKEQQRVEHVSEMNCRPPSTSVEHGQPSTAELYSNRFGRRESSDSFSLRATNDAAGHDAGWTWSAQRDQVGHLNATNHHRGEAKSVFTSSTLNGSTFSFS